MRISVATAGTFVCLGLSLQIAGASNLWTHIDKRFQSLSRNQLVWQADIEIVQPIGNSDLEVLQQQPQFRNTRYLFNIKTTTRLSTLVYDEGVILMGRAPFQLSPPSGADQRSKVALNEYIFVFTDDYNILVEGFVNADPTTGKYPDVFPLEQATVWKPGVPTLFLIHPTGYPSANWQPNSPTLIFLANLNPNRLKSLEWKIVNTQKDQTIVESEFDGGRVRIWYGNGELVGVPMKMEIVRGDEKQYYETTRVAKKGDVAYVEAFTYSAELGRLRESVRFTLTNIQKLDEPFHLNHIPQNVFVSDFRHLESNASPRDLTDERAVKYRWEGVLPSEEELQNLAYQQGNLLPTSTPQRRYSLVLFAPALLFFAGALYLYWKQRRR